MSNDFREVRDGGRDKNIWRKTVQAKRGASAGQRP